MNIPTSYPTLKTIDSLENILFVVDGACFYILSDCVSLIIFIIQQTLSEW